MNNGDKKKTVYLLKTFDVLAFLNFRDNGLLYFTKNPFNLVLPHDIICLSLFIYSFLFLFSDFSS